MFEIVNRRRRQTPEHGYTISSPCEPDGSGELKIRVSYFLTRNPYMKFQNPSIKCFLNGRTDTRMDKPKANGPHFFKVGGVKYIFVEGNVISIYAKFQLHSFYGF